MPTANRSVRFSAEVIYSQRRTLTDCLPQCCVSALWLSVCGQTSPYFSHNVPGRDETRRAGKPSGFVDSVWWTMLDLNQRPPACEAGALPTELIVRVRKSTGLQHLRQPKRAAAYRIVPVAVPESLRATSWRSPGLTMW